MSLRDYWYEKVLWQILRKIRQQLDTKSVGEHLPAVLHGKVNIDVIEVVPCKAAGASAVFVMLIVHRAFLKMQRRL